jgi:hypothetical protein
MPNDMPDADHPETDTQLAQTGAPDEAAHEPDSRAQPAPKDDVAKEASGTRHTQPGEDAAGWKAASDASKDDSDDSRP